MTSLALVSTGIEFKTIMFNSAPNTEARVVVGAYCLNDALAVMQARVPFLDIFVIVRGYVLQWHIIP